MSNTVVAKAEKVRMSDAWSAMLGTVVGACQGANDTIGLYNKSIGYLDASLDQAIQEQSIDHRIDMVDRKNRLAELEKLEANK